MLDATNQPGPGAPHGDAHPLDIAAMRGAILGEGLDAIAPPEVRELLSSLGEPLSTSILFAIRSTGCRIRRDTDIAPPNHPTPHQMRVAALVARGKTNKEIAREMDVVESTVKLHVKALCRKLGVSNRVQLAVWYWAQQGQRDKS